jgi:hypothetical protein
MFRKSKLGGDVRQIYRRALRVIGRFDRGTDRSTYYDYLRIKVRGNAHLSDDKVIKRLLSEANEELGWVENILNSKPK